MGTDNRNKKRHLVNQLMNDATGFNFFEAVRRLEQLSEEKPRIGRGASPDDEAVRFGQEPSLAFPTSTIAEFQLNPKSDAGRMIVHFLGLLGPNGPMPLHLTEFVRMRTLNYYDPTLQRFLDIFHHRMVALFYRAWALNEQAVSYDRDEDDWFSHFVGCLIGLDSDAAGESDEAKVPFYGKCFWSGRLIQEARNAEGLETILSDYFELPAKVEEFVSTWLPIPERYYCLLGGREENCTLGVNAVLGSSAFTKTEKFRIVIGPLSLEDFERMLPSETSFLRLGDWVESYLSKPLIWELQYVLKKEEVPETCLGSYGRLGLTSWLKSQPMTEDDDALLIQSGHRAGSNN